MFYVQLNYLFIFVIIIFSTTLAQFKLNVPEDDGICENWNRPSEFSSKNCSHNGIALHCFGGMSNLQNITDRRLLQVEELVLCGYPNHTFDPVTVLKRFKRLKILRIEHSNLTHIRNDFPPMKYLESINISWTELGYMRPTLFEHLKNLKFLDLRWNQLDHMESKLKVSKTFDGLFLNGNPWNCSGNLRWLINPENISYVQDRDILLCADPKYQNRPVVVVMTLREILRQECLKLPTNCTCTMAFIHQDSTTNTFIPLNTVNCSHQNLEHFPAFLPANTTIIHLEHNHLTTVDPIKSNPNYRNVLDIYLDYNQIESIDILEADEWLQSFRVFSLRGNRLNKLPDHTLKNSLEKNPNALKLYLSHNPWRCDCLFVPKFQDILKKHHSIIKDLTNVTCKYVEGDDLFGRQVLSLKISDVCKLPAEYKIHPLDLLNGVLATLIVLVLGKLAYDYWRYRRYGKVPWIVSKMP